MKISLPQVKVDKTTNNCKGLLENPSPFIREVARVSELLVSSFRAVKYMKLFSRSIELCKSAPLSDRASYQDETSISSRARSDLQWVIDNLANDNGCPLTERLRRMTFLKTPTLVNLVGEHVFMAKIPGVFGLCRNIRIT